MTTPPFFPPPYRVPDGSPSKRQRLSTGPSRSRANSVSVQPDGVDKARQASTMRLLDAWSQLAERYTKGLDEDDVIDLRTGTVIEDYGVLRNAPRIEFGSFMNTDDAEQSESIFDDDPDDEDIDELDSLAEPYQTIDRLDEWQLPPIQEMDPIEAAAIQEFLEANRRLMGPSLKHSMDEVEDDNDDESIVLYEDEDEGEGRMQGTVEPVFVDAGANRAHIEPVNNSDDLEPLPDDPSTAEGVPLMSQEPLPDDSDDDEFGAWRADDASSFCYVVDTSASCAQEENEDHIQPISASQRSSSPLPSSPLLLGSRQSNPRKPRKLPSSTTSSPLKTTTPGRSNTVPPLRILQSTDQQQLHTPPPSHSPAPPNDDGFIPENVHPFSLPTPEPFLPSPSPSSIPSPLSSLTSSPASSKAFLTNTPTILSRSPESTCVKSSSLTSMPRLDLKQLAKRKSRKPKSAEVFNNGLSSVSHHARGALPTSQRTKSMRRAQTPGPPGSGPSSSKLDTSASRLPRYDVVEVVIPVSCQPTAVTTQSKYRATSRPRLDKRKAKATSIDLDSNESGSDIEPVLPRNRPHSTRAESSSPPRVKPLVVSVSPEIKNRKDHQSQDKYTHQCRTETLSRWPRNTKGRRRGRSSDLEIKPSDYLPSTSSARPPHEQNSSIPPSRRAVSRTQSRSPSAESTSSSNSPSTSPMRIRTHAQRRSSSPEVDSYLRSHEFLTSSSSASEPSRRHHSQGNPALPHRYATPADDPRVLSILSNAMSQISYLFQHGECLPPPGQVLPPWTPFTPSRSRLAWPPGLSAGLSSAVTTPSHYPYTYSYPSDPTTFSPGTLPPSSPLPSSPASSPVRSSQGESKRATARAGSLVARSKSRGRRVSFRIEDEGGILASDRGKNKSVQVDNVLEPTRGRSISRRR